MERNDCVCQTTVKAHPMGSSSDGYGCYMTGGHCRPDVNNCTELVEKYHEDQEILKLIEDGQGYYYEQA